MVVSLFLVILNLEIIINYKTSKRYLILLRYQIYANNVTLGIIYCSPPSLTCSYNILLLINNEYCISVFYKFSLNKTNSNIISLSNKNYKINSCSFPSLISFINMYTNVNIYRRKIILTYTHAYLCRI